MVEDIKTYPSQAVVIVDKSVVADNFLVLLYFCG